MRPCNHLAGKIQFFNQGAWIALFFADKFPQPLQVVADSCKALRERIVHFV